MFPIGDWMEMINGEKRLKFFYGDCRQFRELWLTGDAEQAHPAQHIALSGGVPAALGTSFDFACNIPGCGRAFQTANALRMHQRCSQRPGHRYRNKIQRACISNKCIWCGAVFASRASCFMHMSRSYTNNRCLLDQQKFEYDLDVIESGENLQCPFCEHEVDSLTAMNWHIA